MNLDKYRKRKKCSVCEETLTQPILTLRNYPITEIYLDEYESNLNWKIDQEFYLCDKCGHGQLGIILPKGVLYSKDYKFITTGSGSTKANDFLLDFIEKQISTHNIKFNKIIDIGCNDGYLLKKLKGKSKELIGIDPTIETREEDGINFIGGFIEEEDINLEDALVISNHVMEHIEEPRKFLSKLINKANDNTTFIFSYPSLDYLIENCRFDQIFHHHLQYFSLSSSLKLINDLGCSSIETTFNPRYWGSLLISFRKNKEEESTTNHITRQVIIDNYKLFLERMSIINKTIEINSSDFIYGYGAGYQMPVLSYYLPNLRKNVTVFLDDNKDKNGKFYPGLPQEIVNPTNDMKFEDRIIMITAPNESRAILKRVLQLNPKKILIPLEVI